MITPLQTLLATLEDCAPTVTYHGAINADLQNMLCAILEEHTERMGIPKLARKRMLCLSVECLHNLYHHAEDREDARLGTEQVFFSVGRKKDRCYIACGNFVSKSVAQFLEKRLGQLKAMTSDELHSLFLDTLAHPGRSTKGGGGLGLLEMMRKTDRNIDFSLVEHHADRYYFMLILNLPVPQ